MRAIWTGAVAFGLVNVPVKAYAATSDHDISLHQVHDADGGRIRYQRRCEVCGEKVDYAHIDKAYDDGERTVVITSEDFESLPAERGSREIEVVQFVPNEQIDPIMLERSYYLEPDSKSPKAYLLLRQTLEDTDRTAIVKFALRQKTRLGALRVRDNVLLLQSLLWADEVREADFPATDSKAKIGAQELKMASALVDQFSGDFNPEDFEDDYQVELNKLIEAKLEQGDALDTEATFGLSGEEKPSGGGDVIDLMEALKRSLDSKRGRGAAKGKAAGKQSGDDAADEGGDEGGDASDAGSDDGEAPQKPASSRRKAPASSSTARKRTSAAGDKESGAKKTASTRKTAAKTATKDKTDGEAKPAARSTRKTAAQKGA
jgi:DNA end-binding protein Ku